MTTLDLVSLPKAELHVHLEGTLEPDDLLRFARRSDVALPWSTPDEVRAAYDYDGLDDFLSLYWQGCQVLCTPRDLHDLAEAYLERVAQQGVRWVELSLAPQNFLPRGLSVGDQLAAVGDALDEARDRHGIEGGVVVVVQRHRPESEGLELLDAVRPHRSHVVAIGLGGPELPFPPSAFASLFAEARADGYRLTAHAGEEGPPDYVRQALELGVERIDHGVTAAQDPELLAALARDRVPVTVCPLSNLRLHVVDDLAQHPLRDLLDAGVHASISSDDPPYFGGDLVANHRAITDALELDDAQVVTLARQGFTGSFAPERVVASGLAALDEVEEQLIQERDERS